MKLVHNGDNAAWWQLGEYVVVANTNLCGWSWGRPCNQHLLVCGMWAKRSCSGISAVRFAALLDGSINQGVSKEPK